MTQWMERLSFDRINRIDRIKNCFFGDSNAVNVAVNEAAFRLKRPKKSCKFCESCLKRIFCM